MTIETKELVISEELKRKVEMICMFAYTELTNKLKEQKQYENLSFTVDDLLIIQDKQEIDTFVNSRKIYRKYL